MDNEIVTASGGAGPSAGNPRYLAGRYRLEEVLGRGTTGTVWAAYDEVLRRRVAVKEVPPPAGMPPADADALRERTLREARSIAVLSHPNVVTLYDVVREDGEPFVVMELLPAQSLSRIINERGPLDVAGAALVGFAVASALQAAHDAGITHRDVKPGNVLIGSGPAGGRIKLTDFGIARNVAESTMTATGMTLGSPSFIAPEVASGGPVGPAADLWGLGATLFAAVQGHPPYDAGDPMATVAEVVHGEVPRPSAAGPLTPVITGLMVKDPAKRMPLAEVRRLLRPLLPPDGQVLRDVAMTTVLTALPRPPQRAEPSAAAADTGGGVPLAPHPGPLPFPPARQQRPRRRSALARTALALASLLIFAGGMVGGFALSRWTAGVPVVPTLAQRSAISTPAPTTDPDGLRVQEVAITNDRPGTTDGVVTRFAIGVPAGWVAYRPPLSSADTPLLAMFVSPEGNRAISVDHLRDFYPRGTIKNYLTRTQTDLAKAVDEVVAQPVNPVGPPAAGSPEGPFETSFRTVQRGSAGEVLRTTLVRLQPAGADLWVIKVTVPSDQQKAADALYTDVVASFRPIGI